MLGWSWLFPPYRWTFDARAAEETSVIALDGVCLRGKCEDDTDLGYRLMQRFAQLAAAACRRPASSCSTSTARPAVSHDRV